MQSRIKSNRNRRRSHWLSSVPGSTFVTLTCGFLTCAILLPRLWSSQQSSPTLPSQPTAKPFQKQTIQEKQTLQEPKHLAQAAGTSAQNPDRTPPKNQPTQEPTRSAQEPVRKAEARPVRVPQKAVEPDPPRSIALAQRTVAGIPLFIVDVDLTDRKTFIGVGLANQATQANSARSTKGDEAFNSMVKRYKAAATANGTFFSMDSQKRVMGNMVSGGRFLKYSPWENYGTTLGLLSGNRPEMVTARVEGRPKWEQHWFSLTAGPRLLKQGDVSINPKQEGFTDPAVMGIATRSAIGFSERGNRLMLVTFNKPVSLQKEAIIMKALGCYEAMNLDGGTSVALAYGDRVLQAAGRDLTNVITFYDAQHPAPGPFQQAWTEFQKGDKVALR
jgi:hypothetical protein